MWFIKRLEPVSFNAGNIREWEKQQLPTTTTTKNQSALTIMKPLACKTPCTYLVIGLPVLKLHLFIRFWHEKWTSQNGGAHWFRFVLQGDKIDGRSSR